ncbi:MAG: TetR family transcriptional regulator [Actinobacteria bacterium]|nr:TetR family transcriptional regulator [Actinomycetota bacterium]
MIGTRTGELGLREQKKRDTFMRVVAEARSLVDQHGLDGVTVEQIATASGISSRTFFNYFSCKEEAVIGSDPRISDEAAEELRRRPAGESPVAALRALLFREGDDSMLQRWGLRIELVRRHPELLPRHLVAFDRVNRVFTEAIAERMGVDAARDPRPAIVVSAVIAAVRSTVTWWQQSDRSTELVDELNAAFALLESMELEMPRG